MKKALRVPVVSVLVLLSLSSDAYAYLDPGSSTLILQLVFSFAAGIFFVSRQARGKARAVIGWIRKIVRNVGRALQSPEGRQ